MRKHHQSRVAPCNYSSLRLPRAGAVSSTRVAVVLGAFGTFGTFTLLGSGCGGEGAVERDSLDGHQGSLETSRDRPAPSPAHEVTPASDDASMPSALEPGPPPYDGDDAPQRIIEIGELTNSPAPAECVAGLPARLPDCSLEDPTPRGLDCDGDGVLGHRIYNCDVATAERPSLFAGDFDCEPDDPGLRYWVSRDADGDGVGSGPSLCAGPRLPDGYVRLAEHGQNHDCDDSVRAIHPGADEIWGDGFDADCSNSDFPACGRFAKGSTPSRILATDGCSDGPDLYLSSIAACGDRCLDGGSLFGFVGNSGTAPAAGPLRLGYRDDRGRSGQIEVSPDGLAPSAATSLFEVPFSLIGRLEIWVESGDCDPDNQRYVLELPGDPDAICPI
jgi:hypothetical protein